ncbi:MAG: TrkH family potassium uptake protein [Trueperaceae bacterium]|nr:TrkH family potassium uptake protein [Trueperaceae bacterium]
MRAPGAPRRGRFVPRVLGIALAAEAVALAAFGVAAAFTRDPVSGFAVGAALAAGLAGPLLAWGRAAEEPSRREALASVLLLWLALPGLGVAPYLASGAMGPIDALFESMSGFTSTGATALGDFGAFGPVTFLWRAFTQWVGGIGIIVLFIAVFPQLAIAGRQLFFTEVPGPTEDRFTPRLRQTASAVLRVYVGATVLGAVAYLWAGMGPFDAVAHALTTLAAGGFSPEPRSFEGFGPAVQWVAIALMAVAGVNFALQVRVWSGRPGLLPRDPEFRTYLAVAVAGAAALAVLTAAAYGPDALRHGAFQSLSILTTTGYASVDFGAWEPRAQTILLLLAFVGGSAGSAAGGMKVVRWIIIARNTTREVRRVVHPRAVLPVRIGRRTVPEEVLRSVAAFVTLYVGLFATGTTLLALLGADFVTAFSASIGALGNVGPGLGAVGPMEHYGVLPGPAKVVLTFLMYAGRLEVVAVFVVFTREAWRVPRRWRTPARGGGPGRPPTAR